MIHAEQLSLTYPDGTVAMQPADFHIKKGELVYITGASGSGKTSLIKMLMGQIEPTGGELSVLGTSMKNASPKQLQSLRLRLGPVFQEFRLINGKTVMDNVLLSLRIGGKPDKQMKEKCMDALAQVGLSHKASAFAETLSFGEKQRTAIARAVVREPHLILADEPTGNLDHDNAVNILHLLSSLQTNERTVIITTHATHLIEDRTDALHIRIDQGHIASSQMFIV